MHCATGDRGVSIADLLTQAEINDRDLEFLVEKDVRRLQIFVQNTLRVQGPECNHKLNGQVSHEPHQVS